MPSSDHESRGLTPVAITVRVDCSCGASYTVAMPLGEGQYAVLEKARQAHAGIPENVSGLVHYVHDSEISGAVDNRG
jgi:hypothetical protein